MKLCKHCFTEKPLTKFRPQRAECRDCFNFRRRKAYAKNPTKILASVAKYNTAHKKEKSLYNAKYRELNKEKLKLKKHEYYLSKQADILASAKQLYLDNREEILAYKKQYAKDNPEKINARNRKRMLAQLNRVPKWLTKSDLTEIEWAYKIAKDLTKETGIKHVVDHIIPLQGKNISGLHCSQNLQIITAKENNIKKNKFPYQKVM